MKILLSFVFLLACPFSGFSNDYKQFYKKVNSACHEFYFKKNPQKAINLFIEASKSAPLRAGDLETLAECYLATKDTINAVKYLKETILKGNHIERVKNLCSDWHHSRYYKNLESSFTKLRADYFSSINIESYLKVQEALTKDQFVRELYKKFSGEKAYENIMRSVDSVNTVMMKSIYEEAGIPQGCSYEMFVIFNHGLMELDSVWLELQPKLKKGIEQGKISPDTYARLFDRRRVEVEHKSSWYGEFTDADIFSGEIGAIDDLQNVDSRRVEIGLSTLKEKAEISDLKLPQGYTLK